MKLFIPAVILGGILLSAVSGCGGGGGSTDTPVALVPGPNTTTINGVVVPLTITASGLQYYDTTVGTGVSPTAGQTVSVNYVGTLLDGTQFDASPANTPVSFGLTNVIPGFSEGIGTMKVGGKRRLVIPGNLAYGANPPTAKIPQNATLVFDVTLVAVK